MRTLKYTGDVTLFTGYSIADLHEYLDDDHRELSQHQLGCIAYHVCDTFENIITSEWNVEGQMLRLGLRHLAHNPYIDAHRLVDHIYATTASDEFVDFRAEWYSFIHMPVPVINELLRVNPASHFIDRKMAKYLCDMACSRSMMNHRLSPRAKQLSIEQDVFALIHDELAELRVADVFALIVFMCDDFIALCACDSDEFLSLQ